MTVRDLLHQLQNLDPDARVEFWLPGLVIRGDAAVYTTDDGVIVIEPA